MTTSVAQTRVIDLLDFRARAAQATRVFLAGLPPDRWTAPTNCDMDARALVNHIVTGHLWAAELAGGRTIADVGDRLDRDDDTQTRLLAMLGRDNRR